MTTLAETRKSRHHGPRSRPCGDAPPSVVRNNSGGRFPPPKRRSTAILYCWLVPQYALPAHRGDTPRVGTGVPPEYRGHPAQAVIHRLSGPAHPGRKRPSPPTAEIPQLPPELPAKIPRPSRPGGDNPSALPPPRMTIPHTAETPIPGRRKGQHQEPKTRPRGALPITPRRGPGTRSNPSRQGGDRPR